eukprot:763456-Hanusia_phi.AAC.2
MKINLYFVISCFHLLPGPRPPQLPCILPRILEPPVTCWHLQHRSRQVARLTQHVRELQHRVRPPLLVHEEEPAH